MRLFEGVTVTGNGMTRRQWLIGSGCLGLGLTVASVAEVPVTGVAQTEPYPADAQAALVRLKHGNRRFMNDKSMHAHEGASWRSLLVAEQKPFATILGCSDSRAPPELVFDAGFGDLFTIRVAGNIIAEDVLGTLQYAVAHLHTPLVVVMGHEGCGAVTATIEEMLSKTPELEHIESLIHLIEPGLRKLDLKLERKALLSAAVEANVRWSMQQLLALPGAKRMLREKLVTLVGAVYELNTGSVRFLD
jgi:carbonic anhydrase